MIRFENTFKTAVATTPPRPMKAKLPAAPSKIDGKERKDIIEGMANFMLNSAMNKQAVNADDLARAGWTENQITACGNAASAMARKKAVRTSAECIANPVSSFVE